MFRIRTVLCPTDFSDLTIREVELAVEISRAFDSTLVLHHNLSDTAPGMSKGWEWQEEHRRIRGSATEVERRLRQLMRQIDPTIRVEARITTGPLIQALLALVESLRVDLMVLGSHGDSTVEHASVCERLLARAVCPLLCFQAGEQTGAPFRLRPTAAESTCISLVAVDLSGDAAVLQYAFDLARSLPLHLHLLAVVSGGSLAAEKACQQLAEAVPVDLRHRVECHGRTGHPIREIVRCADTLRPAFLIMGEHGRGSIRTWLTRNTSRAVLHRVRLPVWFVPPGHSASA